MGLLALSAAATLALVFGIVVAVGFAAGLVFLALRHRGAAAPDIPPGMKPGPADDILERRQLEKMMGWGILFTMIFALWVPVLWFLEPEQNVDDELELMARAVERGERWFQVTSEENPTGFGCARCHGEAGQGGQVIPFTNAAGQEVLIPPPPLNAVCDHLTVEEIRETIEQGREGTPMPSWSVRYEGPMNDQQIQDIISYLVELNEETVGTGPENLCLNPPSDTETEADTPTGTETPDEDQTETPSGDEIESPAEEESP
jgi:mono/diheme cytochrome c family protein